jgi:hypothetical protein
MKRSFILVAVLLIACSASYAQTQKGDQTLGLNFAFAYNNSSGVVVNGNNTLQQGGKTTQFSIGPSYSYFIADKLDLGTTFSFLTNTSTYPPGYNISKYSTNNIGGIVYLRKYCMFNDKLGLRTGPYVGYNYNKTTETFTGTPAVIQDTKTDYYNAGMRLELVYYPSKRLGLSTYLASLDYNHFTSSTGTSGHNSGDNFYFNVIGSGLSISVFYAFGK